MIAGYAAGQLPIDGDVIGPWTTVFAAELLLEFCDATAQIASSDEEAFTRAVLDVARRRGRLIGYGVPFRRQDERLVHLSAYIRKSGRADLPFWRLQEKVSECLFREKKLLPNLGIGCAATLLDLGFTPRQVGAVTFFVHEVTYIPNAIEAADQRAACLRRLPDDVVTYTGPPPRRSPRARAST
jgi:hypothetical protein